MNVKLKGFLHLIVNLSGNAAIWSFIPENYKLWVWMGFNIIAVVYAYLDPTYTFEMIKMGKVKLPNS